MMEKEWWKNKIAEDIYETFRNKELMFSPYHGHSPQLWSRRHLVDWLALIVSRYKLETTSQHLAIHLLDYFMDKLEVHQDHLYLLALTCLIVAVKFEEHCEKTPSLDSLNSLIPRHSLLDLHSGYTKMELLTMEITLLNYFDWSLSRPTTAQFLPYFLQVSVDWEDLLNGVPLRNAAQKEAIEACVRKHALYFQEVSLQDQCFREYPPSLVAAACITATRITLQLTSTWPKQLELMTDYYLEELLPCVHTLLRIGNADKYGSFYPSVPPVQTFHYNPIIASQQAVIPPAYCSYSANTSGIASVPYTSGFPSEGRHTPAFPSEGRSQYTVCRGS